MIVGAAVCPGAPFLVPGTAERLAGRSATLIGACIEAILPLAAAERIVIIAAGGPDVRVFPAGSVAVSGAPLRRSDGLARPRMAVGGIVGRALVDRAFPAGAPVPVDIVEVIDDPAAGAAALRHLDPARLGLLVIADGAATHGDDAPGRRDDRAGPFDDELATALSSGDPAAVQAACADRPLAAALRAVTDPLLVLAALTAAGPPDEARLIHRGAPFGVGYLVAAWRWRGGQ